MGKTHRDTDSNVITKPTLYFKNKGSKLERDANEVLCEEMYWIRLTWDTVKWFALVNTVMNCLLVAA